MKNMNLPLGMVVLLLFMSVVAGCAGRSSRDAQRNVAIFETSDVQAAHDVMGPISVNEEVEGSHQETIQGIAGYISKDGRVSDQIPEEMKTALEIQKEKHKEAIYIKLQEKANQKGADAIIGTEYLYIPAYVSFSPKAMIVARGTMIKFRK